MLYILISISADEIVANLRENLTKIKDYTAKMESKVPKENGKTEYKLYSQKYMDGWVYMEVLDGENKGGIAVYNPKTGKVRAKKGFLKVTLSPNDNRLRSPKGHRIYESHIPYFIKRVKSAEFLSEGTLFGKRVYIIKVPLQPSENYGASYSKYWIDSETFLPVMVVDYTSDGNEVRTVNFRDIRVNVGLTQEDFKI